MIVNMATATYNRRNSGSTGSIRTEFLVGTGRINANSAFATRMALRSRERVRTSHCVFTLSILVARGLQTLRTGIGTAQMIS
jgi:hypothetical protein